ncbi:hypothetical protein F2Q68_00004903 [Brassica cretica]|uniref:Replication factor A C-terminal domain-containing protein n=1 Tax=Brassica cretica TaxID=69181 RepID=A0A8S9J6R0_BRACR|nr:hypothetical protein F2Q68_00004903 [Brassica cretica]
MMHEEHRLDTLGALSISSLSSSRVFFDLDVQPTRDYLTWLGSNSDVSNRVARFECTATIDDVMLRSAWYYIACGGCKTKATKGPTTLMCKKFGKAEVAGVAEYLTNISVYNNNDHARFVLLYDAGCDQTRKLASELVESYFEANESVGDDAVVPVPQALVDTIGQTRKFVVKVSKHNLEGKTQALTVTKVLPLEAPVLEGVLEENVDEEPADERDEAAGKLDSSSSIFQLSSNPISSALTEQSRSSSARSRLRRFSEVVNSFGDHCHFRSRVPFKSFDDCLQESRLLFSQTVPTIGGYSLRHHNDEATNGYRFLCLRGFVVQGSLDPKDRLLDDVFRFIDNIGWSYTVMHVHPFYPRVVR